MRVGPPGQCLGSDDPAIAQMILRLISNPHLAVVDCGIELTEQRKPPSGLLLTRGIMIFPFEPVGPRIVRSNQCTAESIGKRATAAKLDPESDCDVDRLASNRQGRSEQ